MRGHLSNLVYFSHNSPNISILRHCRPVNKSDPGYTDTERTLFTSEILINSLIMT